MRRAVTAVPARRASLGAVATPKAPRRAPPDPLARMVGFALLGLLGATEWARMLDGGGLAEALPWVLAAVLAGETVGAAGSLRRGCARPGRALAAVAGLVLAALVSGLEPRLLAPRYWDELGSGRRPRPRGAERRHAPLHRRRPVARRRCASAARCSSPPRRSSPRGRAPRAAASSSSRWRSCSRWWCGRSPPSASTRSLVLGCAIAALTVCFLWLERLPLRPGLGVAVLGGIALAGACR